jgi:hypothetical protein
MNLKKIIQKTIQKIIDSKKINSILFKYSKRFRHYRFMHPFPLNNSKNS